MPGLWVRKRRDERFVALADEFLNVFLAYARFVLGLDTVEPDISFISNERLAAGPAPQMGKFIRIVPNLVVEILSPATAQRDQTEKKAIYAVNGVGEYWIADTNRREITVYPLTGKRYGRGAVYTARDTLRSRVLAGFTLQVGEVFV